MAKTKRQSTPKPKRQQKPSTKQVTVFDSRREPPTIAHGMDVDRIHSILRSAESGDTRDLFALYRDITVGDSHLQGEWAKRKIAVLQDQLHFMPVDPKAQVDIDAAELCVSESSACQSWLTGMSSLLDATLYPVAVAEKVFRATGNARRPFALQAIVNVPAHLFDFTTGRLRIYDVDPATGVPLATTHEPDPNRYIIHRGHVLSTPDQWGGPMRSLLFWWLLSTMDREWWARYLDRYGSPFLVGTYDRGDADSRSVLERAFSLAVKLGGLVVSDGTRVDIKESASSSTGESYERFLTICQREKSKLIVGQTLSAEAQPQGIGGGASTQQEQVRQDIRQFDGRSLASTIRDQLLTQLVRINGLPGSIPQPVFASTLAEERSKTLSTLKDLRSTDVEPDDKSVDGLSATLGIGVRRRTVSAVAFAAPGGGRLTPFRADSYPVA